MSLTAPLEKRTFASVLFACFCMVLTLMGAGLIYLGGQSALAGGSFSLSVGSFYYAALGITLVVSGVQLLRRRRSGLWVFGLALLATWAWLIWGSSTVAWADITHPVWVAVLGLIMLAFWPVARKRLVGVAKPGYVIINGMLPLGILLTMLIPLLGAR